MIIRALVHAAGEHPSIGAVLAQDAPGQINTTGVVSFIATKIAPILLAVLGVIFISRAGKGEMSKVITSSAIAIVGLAFIAGASFCYFAVLPQMFKFLLREEAAVALEGRLNAGRLREEDAMRFLRLGNVARAGALAREATKDLEASGEGQARADKPKLFGYELDLQVTLVPKQSVDVLTRLDFAPRPRPSPRARSNSGIMSFRCRRARWSCGGRARCSGSCSPTAAFPPRWCACRRTTLRWSAMRGRSRAWARPICKAHTGRSLFSQTTRWRSQGRLPAARSYDRRSASNPSARLASTVSAPLSCSW